MGYLGFVRAICRSLCLPGASQEKVLFVLSLDKKSRIAKECLDTIHYMKKGFEHMFGTHQFLLVLCLEVVKLRVLSM